MSEDQQVIDSDLGGPGVEKRAGYTPMPMATPDPPREDYHDLDPGEGISAEEAGEALANRRAEAKSAGEKEVIPRAYIHQGGEHAGEEMSPDNVVPIDRAARDISSAREAEESTKLTQIEADLIRQLDAAQAEQQPQPQQTEAPPVEQQPEPQAQQPNADDELVAELQRNPKLLNAFSTLAEQAQQQITASQNEAVQYAQAAQQHYAGVVQQNAQAAFAGLIASFPELQGLQTQQDLATAIQTVSRTDPARGAAITQYIQRVSNLVSEHQRVQHAQQQQYFQQQQQYQAAQQERFQKSAAVDDAQLERYAKTQMSDQQFAEVRKEALAYLREDLGMDDQTIGQLYHSDPVFRSYQAQRLVMDAARFRMAQRGARNGRANPVPTVQRPGSPMAIGSQEDFSARELSARLDRSTGRDALQAAAALVSARRAKR